MSLSISELRYLISGNNLLNPFSKAFSKDSLQDLVMSYDSLDSKAESFIRFIEISSESYLQLIQMIWHTFDKLSLTKEELIDILFHACNEEHFKSSILIGKAMLSDRYTHDVENNYFLEIKGEGGINMHAITVPEMQVDITAELIRLSHDWEPQFEQARNLNTVEESFIRDQIRNAWLAANIIINLRDQCFELLLFDNCYAEWQDERSLKIKRELPTIDFIRTAAQIRSNQNILEATLQLKQAVHAESSFQNLTLSDANNGKVTLLPLRKENGTTALEGLATLIKYHAPYLKIPLDYYNNLTITDLVGAFEKVVVAFKESSLWQKQLKEDEVPAIPTHFKKSELLQALSQVLQNNEVTAGKLLDSLICDQKNPYFWKSPFYSLGDKIYFPIHAVLAPNFNLYIEKWIAKDNFSYTRMIDLFKSFLILNTKNETFKFQCKILDPIVSINESGFESNILIITRDNALLLELVVFPYPIEYNEHKFVMDLLANSVFQLKEKLKKLSNNNTEVIRGKSMCYAVISEYPNYSGLIINEVPIIDTSLLNNYFLSGKFYKAAFDLSKSNFPARQVASIQYYKDEDSFNQNIEDFFLSPVPVTNIVRNMQISEVSILPSHLPLTVTIEVSGHIGEAKVLEGQTKEIENLMVYKYYIDPNKNITAQIDQKVYFNLSVLLEKLCRISYVPNEERARLIEATMNAKSIGHSHLVHYLLKASSGLPLNFKKQKSKFNLVKIDQNIAPLLDRLQPYLKGDIQLSEFEMPKVFTDKESRLLISMAIEMFDHFAYKQLKDDDVDTLMLNLLILQGFRKKYELKSIFFIACANMVDLLNQSNHFQKARDFCEEVLHLSIKSYDHPYAWLLFFNCYTYQMNLYEAGFYGCLFFSSLRGAKTLSYEVSINGIFALMKFFRNFGYYEYTLETYKSAIKLPISSFDKLKLAAVYFYSKFKQLHRQKDALCELPGFLEKHEATIKGYGAQACIPWLVILFNLLRLEKLGTFKTHFPLQNYIDKFSENLDDEILAQIKNKVLGKEHNFKEDLINALLTAFETRDIHDFVNEINQLTVITYNVIQQAFKKNDPEGILLASLVLSDQTLAFKNIESTEKHAPIIKQKNIDLISQFNNYQQYILRNISLKPGQLLIWIFEYDGDAGYILCTENRMLEIKSLGPWLRSKLIPWTINISDFHFNSKNLYPIDYDLSAQERDYKSLLQEFKSGDLGISNKYDELLICTSVELSAMPHNLLVNNENFLSIDKPITNVISLQYFIANHQDILLPEKYKLSAWIPIEDGNMTINWGYNFLEPLLKAYNASIHTKGSPDHFLQGDINVFMAHGIREFEGFKAVKTSDDPHSTIIRPANIFGTGCIAILFICNSGSTKDDHYSKQVVSFSTELLKFGYKAVISSFWPYDVTMSKRWLKSFLESLDKGLKLSESVFIANSDLADFDQETSSLFYAPAGRLSMHLYGNANISVRKNNR